MPRGDRTGPEGEGPLTGRQLGYGAGYDSPGYAKAFAHNRGGRAGNRGWGRARGFFWQGQVTAPAEIPAEPVHFSELNIMKAEMEELKSNVSSILKILNKKESVKKEK